MTGGGSYSLLANLQDDVQQLWELTASETAEYLQSVFPHAAVIEVNWQDGRTSLGTMLIWLNPSRSFIRLDEHREHSPADPEVSYDIQQLEEVFIDSTTDLPLAPFTVPFHHTLTRNQSLTVILHWLETGEKHQSFRWS